MASEAGARRWDSRIDDGERAARGPGVHFGPIVVEVPWRGAGEVGFMPIFSDLNRDFEPKWMDLCRDVAPKWIYADIR